MSPALVLTLVLVLGSAGAFHAAFGRTLRGLGVTLVAALAGFVLGEAAARWLGHTRGLIGHVHALHGLAGAWLAMTIARRWAPWR